MYSNCSEVLTDEIPKNTPKHREEVQMWFKHKKIQGFYDVLQVSSYLIKNNHGGGYQKANVDNNLILQNRSFAEGADACISLRFRTCARSSWFSTLTKQAGKCHINCCSSSSSLSSI